MKKILGIVLCLVLLSGCATAKLSNGQESVVTFDEGGISAEDLFEVLKEKYGTKELVTLIDTNLLAREYKETSDENNYILNVILALKSQYGDNYESTIESYYGVSSESEFEEYIRLVYRRDQWEKDYAKSIVTDTEINDYYNNVAIGDIEASHILIKVDSEDEEENALNKAKEVITKLNNGEKFEDLASEYSEDETTKNNGGSLGSFNYKDNFDSNFMEAAVNLKVGEYSKTPVKSQYGYHIIYKTNQKEKPELSEIKDEIISTIAEEKIDNDSTLMTTAIKSLREKYKMNITDTVLSEGYNNLYN